MDRKWYQKMTPLEAIPTVLFLPVRYGTTIRYRRTVPMAGETDRLPVERREGASALRPCHHYRRRRFPILVLGIFLALPLSLSLFLLSATFYLSLSSLPSPPVTCRHPTSPVSQSINRLAWWCQTKKISRNRLAWAFSSTVVVVFCFIFLFYFTVFLARLYPTLFHFTVFSLTAAITPPSLSLSFSFFFFSPRFLVPFHPPPCIVEAPSSFCFPPLSSPGLFSPPLIDRSCAFRQLLLHVDKRQQVAVSFLLL